MAFSWHKLTHHDSLDFELQEEEGEGRGEERGLVKVKHILLSYHSLYLFHQQISKNVLKSPSGLLICYTMNSIRHLSIATQNIANEDGTCQKQNKN